MATSLTTPKLNTSSFSSTLQTLIHSNNKPKIFAHTSPFIISPKSSSSLFNFNNLKFTKKSLGFWRYATKTESSSNGGAEPRQYDYDLFRIGAGSGGVRASRFAANFGASVAVCELSSDTTGGVGGTCVLRGCVPKKLLVYASKYSHEFEESLGFGWSYNSEPTHDCTLMANKNAELQRLTGIYKNILNNSGVKLIEGRGKIVDPHTVDVDGKLYTARNILVSVGGRPFIPDIPGREYVIDSDVALALPSKPTKIAIVGGDYIAVEFAGIFNGLQSEVHVFIHQKQVLRGFDEEPIEAHGDIDVYTANFRPLKATLSGLPDRVFMKLVVSAKTDQVVGLHMCGEDSAEVVQGFAVAIKAGLTKAQFDSTIGVHPTSAEEFVTMRTPTRKFRNSSSGGKTDSEAKAAAGV